MRDYDFVQLDVFTRTALTGNPLAIFPDARGLNDGQMQALAREMNLSETTFILPREPKVEAQEGNRVRIFTVYEELPFAGTSDTGDGAVSASQAGATADDSGPRATDIVDLNVGKIDVRFRADTDKQEQSRRRRCLWRMRQRDPEFGPTLPPDQVAGVLQGDGGAIGSAWPSQPFRPDFLSRLCRFAMRRPWQT